MTKEQREEYYIHFEKLIDCMQDLNGFDHDGFRKALAKLCELFRVAKGVTEFYKSPFDENHGQGEVLCDYDNGHADVQVHQIRINSDTGAVIIGTVYMDRNEKPLTDEEREKVDLIFRTMLSFIARRRLQKAVEGFVFNDEVGYPNSRAYMRFLMKMKAKCGLHGYTCGCFNLRHFGNINREIGRQLGDVVFKSYYMLLAETVGDTGIVCRLGGDNFLLAFRNELSSAVLDVLRGVPVAYDKKGENRVEVSASAGLFTVPDGFLVENTETIMDRIMPTAQAARRDEADHILYFDEKMAKQKEHMIRVQRSFPAALKKREFRVYYQPKVDVFTGEMVGAEALCRWFHKGKLVSPGEFIPVLEQNTDICKLDFYMLDAVCRDIRRWMDEGKKPVRVSVNLSRKHLVDVDLLKHIMDVIEKHRVPHFYVEIELTETTTDVEFRDLRRVVNGLQAQGICTAVDDFGVGYSSLNLIREIPWNILKIDRCFLPEDEKNKYSTTSLMYKHVVAMAHDIGLECVTEGVETVEQVDILRKNHCDIAQGFYFDKPLPVEEFEQRLVNRRYELPK